MLRIYPLQRSTLTGLLLTLLSGCAVLTDELPVLGTVADGTYTSTDQRVHCPLPGKQLHFIGDVMIRDAARLAHHRKRPDKNGVMINEVTHTEIIADSQIRFADSKQPRHQLIIHYYGTPAPVAQGYVSKESFYTSGYRGGNLGLLSEQQLTVDEQRYGIGVAQLPYWSPQGPVYMNAQLWQLHLHSKKPPPLLKFYVNTLRGDRYYHFEFSMSTQPLLPASLNYRDLEAVYQHLQRQPDTIAMYTQHLVDYISQCHLSDT